MPNTTNINVGGTWHKVKKVWLNVAGVWKSTKPFLNVAGVWKSVLDNLLLFPSASLFTEGTPTFTTSAVINSFQYSGLAVGNNFICAVGANESFVFDKNFNQISTSTTAKTSQSPVSDGDYIYMRDYSTSKLRKYDTNLNLIWESVGTCYANLFTDGNYIYASDYTDSSHMTVQKFDRDTGALITSILVSQWSYYDRPLFWGYDNYFYNGNGYFSAMQPMLFVYDQNFNLLATYNLGTSTYPSHNVYPFNSQVNKGVFDLRYDGTNYYLSYYSGLSTSGGKEPVFSTTGYRGALVGLINGKLLGVTQEVGNHIVETNNVGTDTTIGEVGTYMTGLTSPRVYDKGIVDLDGNAYAIWYDSSNSNRYKFLKISYMTKK